MNTIKKDRYYYVNLALCLVFALMLVLCFHINSPVKVYADYEDIILDPTAIVNFNQISNEIGVQHVGTFSSYVYNDHGTVYFPSSLNVSHYYYIKCYFTVNSGNIENIAVFNQNQSQYVQTSDVVTGWSSIGLFRVYGTPSTSYDFNGYVSIIDLSVMFGENNIPSKVQCDDLFIADYYQYNAGTPLSFSTIQAYNNGVNSVVSSVDIVAVSAYDFVNTIQNFVYYDPILDNVFGSYVINRNGTYCEVGYYGGQYSQSGYTCVAVPLTTTILEGNIIHVSGSVASDSGAGDPNSNIAYIFGMTSDGRMVQLAQTSPVGSSSSTPTEFNVSIQVPFNMSYIYYVYMRNYDLYFYDFLVTQQVFNFELWQKQSYADGQQNVLNNFKRGAAGYELIFEAGKQYGIEHANEYTFTGLISAVVDTPIKAFTTLFDFDILGVNMKTFYLSIFTLCMVVTIIRLVL